MKSGVVMWLLCNITLNIRAARMQEGDVEYACDSWTLLQQTCLLERAKKTGKTLHDSALPVS